MILFETSRKYVCMTNSCYQSYAMSFLDVEQVGIGLYVRSQIRTVRQISCPNFRARQMLYISEV